MKSKTYRRFNLLLIPLVAFNLLSIGLFNLVVDPYGILSSLNNTDVNQLNLESEKPSPVPTPTEVKSPVVKTTPQTTLTQRSKYRAKRFKLDLSRLSISRINPKTVVLGTSTALRLSRTHPALTQQPVYNLGLAGSKMHDIRSYFEDILATHPDLKQVVIGLDFYSFGGIETQVKPQKKITSANPITAANTIKPTTEVRRNKYSTSLEELVKINFSLDTFNASIKKVMKPSIQSKQIDRHKSLLPDTQSTQFNAEHSKLNYLPQSFQLVVNQDANKTPEKTGNASPNKAAKKTVNKDANKVKTLPKKPATNKSVKPPISTTKNKLVKPSISTTKNKPVKPPISKIKNKPIKKEFIPYKNNYKLTQFRRVIVAYWSEKTFYKNYHLSKEELNNFKAIVDECKKRNISIKVFFSPVHAAHLEAIHTAGLGPTFEEWKRKVIEITPAWDFSDYTRITTEPINDDMENFVDSVHYDPQIGDLILNRLYNYEKETVPSNFGLYITPVNIESHLSKIRAQRQAWLKTHPVTVKFVQDIKKQANLE